MRSLLVYFASGVCSYGVAISSGDGSGNTTAPVDDPGFANVGTLGGASAVYLGNQWILTANHVGSSTASNGTPVIFDGLSFGVDASSERRIENPSGSGLSTFTDLVMYRLTDDPGLAALDLVMNLPSAGTNVTMIGNGRNRATSETFWDVAVNPSAPDVWTVATGPNPDVAGWETAAGKDVRWGENVITGHTIVDLGAVHGDVISFFTTFDEFGTTHEAQGVNGDSGGAVFLQEGGVWKLAGIMNAVGTGSTFPFDGNPPGETGSNPFPYYGRVTTAADLSIYGSQIEAILLVPEPSSASLVILGGVFFMRRRRS